MKCHASAFLQFRIDLGTEPAETSALVECGDHNTGADVGLALRPLAELVVHVGDLQVLGPELEQVQENLPSLHLQTVPVLLDDRDENIRPSSDESAHDILGDLLPVPQEEQVGEYVERPGTGPTDESECETVVPDTYGEVRALLHLGVHPAQCLRRMLEVAVDGHEIVGTALEDTLEDARRETALLGFPC